MIELRTLGGLELRRATGHSADSLLRQPKHAALLVYLAAGTRSNRPSRNSEFLRRDSLLGLFWPEQSEERARGSLRQMLYALRKDLGSQFIVTRGADEVGINQETVWCDVSAFDEAIRTGDFEAAITLFRGPFLDGFLLKGSVAFDHWMEAERDRLARDHARGLGALAEQAAQSGNVVLAADRLRQLTKQNPYNSRAAIRFMEALSACGDREGAIQFADDFTQRVQADLHAEPSPEVVALAKQLRRPAAGHVWARTHGMELDSVSTLPRTERTPFSKHGWPFRALLQFIGTVTILAIVALASVETLRLAFRAWRTDHEVSYQRFAVFPASVSGIDSLDLGVGFSELLYRALDGAGGLDGVDPNALIAGLNTDALERVDLLSARHVGQRLGAGLYVLSHVVTVGNQLSIRSTLYDQREEEPVASADAMGSEAELRNLAEQIAWDIVSNYGPVNVNRVGVKTPRPRSFGADKAYRRGLTAMSGRGYAAAAEAFRDAVEEDSTFGLAWYQLSVVQGWLDASGVDTAINQAMRYREGIPDPERTMVEADHAFVAGDLQATDSLTATLVSRYPTHINGWYRRGTMFLFYNWRRGRPASEARVPLQRALDIDSKHLPTIWSSMMVAANSGTMTHADSLARVWLSLSPHPFWSPVLPIFGALQNSDDFTGFLNDTPTMQDGAINVAAGFAAVFARDFDRASILTNQLTDSLTRSPTIRATGHLRSAQFAIATGQWGIASREFEPAQRLAGARALAMRAFLTLTAPFDIPPLDLEALRAELTQWNDDTRTHTLGVPFTVPAELEPHYRAYLLGLLHARLGEDEAALHYADGIDRAEVPDSAGLLHDLAFEIRAFSALRRGDLASALAATERIGFNERWAHLRLGSVFYSRSFGRYLRAEILYRAERLTEALSWYESIEFNGGVVAFFGPSHFRRGQIYDRMGDVQNARAQYAEFERIWRNADPNLQPYLASALDRSSAFPSRLKVIPSPRNLDGQPYQER